MENALEELAQNAPFTLGQVRKACQALGGDMAYTAKACLLARAIPGATPYGVALALKEALNNTRPARGYAMTVRTHDYLAAEGVIKALCSKGLPLEQWPRVPQLVLTKAEADRLATKHATTVRALQETFTIV